jgi:hypothetical protein
MAVVLKKEVSISPPHKIGTLLTNVQAAVAQRVISAGWVIVRPPLECLTVKLVEPTHTYARLPLAMGVANRGVVAGTTAAMQLPA